MNIPDFYENLEPLQKLECLELINEFNSATKFGKLYIKDWREMGFSVIDFRMDFMVKADNINYSSDEDYIQNIINAIEYFDEILKDYEPKFRKVQALRF